jgi:predicted small integral membrane protein
MVEPTDLAKIPADTDSDIEKTERAGFLPIETNWFDRIFISVVIGVAVELFWMRLLEQSIPLWIAHVIVLGLTVVIVTKG